MNLSNKSKIVLGVAVLCSVCVTYATLHIASGGFMSKAALEKRSEAALPAPKTEKIISTSTKLSSSLTVVEFWQTADMFKRDIPKSVISASDDVVIHTGYVQMSKAGSSVFYQYTVPAESGPNSGLYVLLLHGAAFSSQNWSDIGTLSMLAAMGHTAVAVDIPGFGKSGGGSAISKNTFVSVLVEELRDQVDALTHLSQPILVSPSMSGQYSIPVMVAEANRPAGTPAALSGFVPVAPVNTAMLQEDIAKKIQVPTLIVRGSRDTSLGTTAERHLAHIPTAQRVVIDGAGHAAYMNQPSVFHLLMYNFLELILEKQI